MAEPDDDDEGPEVPLEGAMCSVHGDRTAFRVCPACTRNACLTCWHPTISRCHACLVKDASTFPPIPWEDRTRTWVGRFARTVLSALSPDTSAPAFARESDTTGAVFAVLTLVPLGLLAGIIPYTRTLLFMPGLEVRVMHGADNTAIAIDMLQAAFIGLGLTLISWLTVALPYMSLCRAYADRGMPTAPLRVMNYRGWLIPLSLLILHTVPACLPASTPPLAFLFVQLLPAVPIVLLLAAMRGGARMGSGAGPVAAFAILMVPLMLMFLSQLMIEPLIPTATEEDIAAVAPAPPSSS